MKEEQEMSQSQITTDQILAATGIQFYRLEYLVKKGEITCQRNGKGNPRTYPADTIDRIRKLEKTGAAKNQEAKNVSQQSDKSLHDAS